MNEPIQEAWRYIGNAGDIRSKNRRRETATTSARVAQSGLKDAEIIISRVETQTANA